MSKLFKDPVYEEMKNSDEGWLDLVIEPFRFFLPEIIQLLPQSLEITYDDLFEHMATSYPNSFYYTHVINDAIKSVTDRQFSPIELAAIINIYSLDIEPGTILDLEKQELFHDIKIVKTFDHVPEDKQIVLAADIACRHMTMDFMMRTGTKEHSEMISRLNDISDVFGKLKTRNSRSVDYKVDELRRVIRNTLKDDVWLIRDYELMKSICIWVRDYCRDGNRHAMMNLMRLKCMTHKEQPIYSMEVMS